MVTANLILNVWMESPITKKKTLLSLEFNNMKDNFDKLFNVVLVLTAFAVVLSVIVVIKAVSIL